MKTLILYSTREGQTKKIAEFMAERLQGEVIVRSITDSDYDLSGFERIVIGASIHYGRFEHTLMEFVEKNANLLNSKSAVFFGINLTARKVGKDTPETNVYVRKFLQRITWKPKLAAVFAGALLYPRYHWFDRMMIQFIMRVTGGETDTSKEIEYTDWNKVNEFIEKINEMH